MKNIEINTRLLRNTLPVFLCLVIPVMNYIINIDHFSFKEVGIGLFLRWGVVSLILYLLWHLLEWVTGTAKTFKWLKVAVAYILFLLVVYLILSLSDFFIEPHRNNISVLRYLFSAIPFLIIQYALRAHQNIIRLELEKSQMQTENYKVQLEALRLKTDPHFLFNSLNTLRSMVRHKHEQSEQFVLSLSDFYRQTLKYNENSIISVAEEVGVLESYLFLMQNRNEDAVRTEINLDPIVLRYKIPTLSLQSVVENCFKHNAMTTRQPLNIHIYSLDSLIVVENNLQPRLDKKENSGFGLENLNKRYSLLGITEGVTTEIIEDTFVVKLKLIG